MYYPKIQYTYALYALRNKVTGQYYIGQKQQPIILQGNKELLRLEIITHYKLVASQALRHYAKGKALRPLEKSFAIHTFEHFSVTILDDVESRDSANKSETFLIKLFDSTNPAKGLNVAKGGSGNIDPDIKNRHIIATDIKTNEDIWGFRTTADAASFLNIRPSSVEACINKRKGYGKTGKNSEGRWVTLRYVYVSDTN